MVADAGESKQLVTGVSEVVEDVAPFESNGCLSIPN